MDLQSNQILNPHHFSTLYVVLNYRDIRKNLKKRNLFNEVLVLMYQKQLLFLFYNNFTLYFIRQ